MKYFQFLSIRTSIIILPIFCIIIPSAVISQNLVPNGDFEESSSKVAASDPLHNTFKYINKWGSPSHGTPDFFHQIFTAYRKKNRLRAIVGVGDNCKPKSGVGYVGIGTFGKSSREYIQVKLTNVLTKNKPYHFEMWVRASSVNSKSFRSGLGVFFSDSKIYYDRVDFTDHYYIGVTPHIYSDTVIKNTIEWRKFESYFIAKGDEEYLTIGYFTAEEDAEIISNMDFHTPESTRETSYIYLDKIVLEIKSPFDDLIDSSSIVLPNITFSSGSEKLEEDSKPMLKALAAFLNKNPGIKINIVGHTDNVGNASKNLTLSKKRAEEIRKYLVSEKISGSRIQTDGKGENEPKFKNTTNSGKLANRRIEIILID